jgi:hypothetical protein
MGQSNPCFFFVVFDFSVEDGGREIFMENIYEIYCGLVGEDMKIPIF